MSDIIMAARTLRMVTQHTVPRIKGSWMDLRIASMAGF